MKTITKENRVLRSLYKPFNDMGKKNNKDIDEFEYRAGKVVVSGKSNNKKVMDLAKTEQLNGLILRYGWLIVGIIAVSLKMYEVTAVVAVTDYLKSLIFKHS